MVYFERNEDLAAAAGRNFQRLGAGNIEVRCETVTPQTELPEADLIYADPARRDAAGRKVFLLEDCTPDILTLLPMLLKKAPAVLLKLSPMADLAMLSERLGPALREIHVVECDGEVKELLCLLLRDNVSPEPDIIVARLFGQAAAVVQQGESLRFRVSEERATEAVYAAGVQPGNVLLEPCPALLKAGAFRLPYARWGLSKLAPSTHLYLAPNLPGIIRYPRGGNRRNCPWQPLFQGLARHRGAAAGLRGIQDPAEKLPPRRRHRPQPAAGQRRAPEAARRRVRRHRPHLRLPPRRRLLRPARHRISLNSVLQKTAPNSKNF